MDELPPWQMTLEFTIKGTADYCRERADKLEAYARRLGIPAPFCEEEPNGDLPWGPLPRRQPSQAP